MKLQQTRIIMAAFAIGIYGFTAVFAPSVGRADLSGLTCDYHAYYSGYDGAEKDLASARRWKARLSSSPYFACPMSMVGIEKERQDDTSILILEVRQCLNRIGTIDLYYDIDNEINACNFKKTQHKQLKDLSHDLYQKLDGDSGYCSRASLYAYNRYQNDPIVGKGRAAYTQVLTIKKRIANTRDAKKLPTLQAQLIAARANYVDLCVQGQLNQVANTEIAKTLYDEDVRKVVENATAQIASFASEFSAADASNSARASVEGSIKQIEADLRSILSQPSNLCGVSGGQEIPRAALVARCAATAP